MMNGIAYEYGLRAAEKEKKTKNVEQMHERSWDTRRNEFSSRVRNTLYSGGLEAQLPHHR